MMPNVEVSTTALTTTTPNKDCPCSYHEGAVYLLGEPMMHHGTQMSGHHSGALMHDCFEQMVENLISSSPLLITLSLHQCLDPSYVQLASHAFISAGGSVTSHAGLSHMLIHLLIKQPQVPSFPPHSPYQCGLGSTPLSNHSGMGE